MNKEESKYEKLSITSQQSIKTQQLQRQTNNLNFLISDSKSRFEHDQSMYHSSTMLPEYFKIVPRGHQYYKQIAQRCLQQSDKDFG